MKSLWDNIGSKVIDEIFVRAAQSRSSEWVCTEWIELYIYISHTRSEFNTIVDIELHKWAESLQLASLCADVGMATMFDQLRKKMTSLQVNTLIIH